MNKSAYLSLIKLLISGIWKPESALYSACADLISLHRFSLLTYTLWSDGGWTFFIYCLFKTASDPRIVPCITPPRMGAATDVGGGGAVIVAVVVTWLRWGNGCLISAARLITTARSLFLQVGVFVIKLQYYTHAHPVTGDTERPLKPEGSDKRIKVENWT